MKSSGPVIINNAPGTETLYGLQRGTDMSSFNDSKLSKEALSFVNLNELSNDKLTCSIMTTSQCTYLTKTIMDTEKDTTKTTATTTVRTTLMNM